MTEETENVETVTVPIDELAIVLERAKHHYNQNLWNDHQINPKLKKQLNSAFTTLETSIETAEPTNDTIAGLTPTQLELAIEQLDKQLENNAISDNTQEQLKEIIKTLQTSVETD